MNKINKTIFFLALVIFLGTCALSTYADPPSIRVSLINQVPDPAKAGGIVELWFRVENVGTVNVDNVALQILPEYPFSLVNDQPSIAKIPSLPLYPPEASSKTIRYRMRVDRNAPSGQFNIKIKSAEYSTKELEQVLNEEEGIKEGRTDSFTVFVTSQEVAEILYVDKSNIVPGKETDLTFTINNIGSSPLENVEFSWSEANGYLLPVKSDNVRHVNFLDVDQSVDLKYKVMASTTASAGLYPLNLKLKFDDSTTKNGTTTKKEISTITGVFIGGETDFKVTSGENTQGQTSLTVANTGSTQAMSVSVNIPEQEFFNVVGSRSSIIGNLDKGDYTIVNFQLTPKGQQAMNRPATAQTSTTARGNRPQGQQTQSTQNQAPVGFGDNRQLQVIIEYTDTTGMQRSVPKTVPLQLSGRNATFTGAGGANGFRGAQSQQTSFWNSNTFRIPVALIIICIIYFLGRRRGWWSQEMFAKITSSLKKQK